MLPPEATTKWDRNHWWLQGLMIAYEQIRNHEENDQFKTLIEAIVGSRISL